MITEKAVRTFADLYEKEFGQKLAESEARTKAERLMQLYRAVYNMPIYVQS